MITQATLDEFINNVFCRRESNQHKAEVLWEEIRPHVSEGLRSTFKTEWYHFLIGQGCRDEDYRIFSHDIEDLKNDLKGKIK